MLCVISFRTGQFIKPGTGMKIIKTGSVQPFILEHVAQKIMQPSHDPWLGGK